MRATGGSMGHIVIAAYRPKPGREADLAALARRHTPNLRAWGLATDMPVTLMRAKDGTILEVFEWHTGAIDKAHSDPRVLEMWGQYAEVCDYIPLNTLAEASDLFATFVPFDEA
jgi:hypothetical protein